MQVLIAPNSPIGWRQTGDILDDGAPVELMEFAAELKAEAEVEG